MIARTSKAKIYPQKENKSQSINMGHSGLSVGCLNTSNKIAYFVRWSLTLAGYPNTTWLKIQTVSQKSAFQ